MLFDTQRISRCRNTLFLSISDLWGKWLGFESSTRRLRSTQSNLFDHMTSLVIQWITSCHKTRMTTRLITLRRVYLTSLTTFMSTMRYSYWNNVHFKGDKIPFRGPYDIPYTLGIFIWSLWNSPKARFINCIWNDHSCKILYTDHCKSSSLSVFALSCAWKVRYLFISR